MRVYICPGVVLSVILDIYHYKVTPAMRTHFQGRFVAGRGYPGSAISALLQQHRLKSSSVCLRKQGAGEVFLDLEITISCHGASNCETRHRARPPAGRSQAAAGCPTRAQLRVRTPR